MKHPHHELIKQWADDTSRVVQYNVAGSWIDSEDPVWDFDREYRFKPEPKPDVVEESHVAPSFIDRLGRHPNNLRLTFSGEDGKLIKAEVM